MKVIGVIAEYNPFHNGHAYQLDTIRKDTGADYIIVAMSGDFVQRGAPAIIDKYSRTKMALSCGADLVLELPALWATASAEFFAMAGVTLFDKAGCIDGICFGAETDSLPLLTHIAEILAEEPEACRSALSSYLKQGLPFPSARAAALCDYICSCKDLPLIDNCDADTIRTILNGPNNILAIEYLKAIKKRGSSLTPYLLKREGAGYHETDIRDLTIPGTAASKAPAASATAIRNILKTKPMPDFSALDSTMPQAALAILQEYLSSSTMLEDDDFSSILGYLLLSRSPKEIAEIADSNEEIASRLLKNRFRCTSFSEFCALNKSRDITYTRMSRILLHLLLNHTNADYEQGKNLDYIPYLRILGFRRASSPLLGSIKKEASVPLISKLANASDLLLPHAMWMLEKDIFASDLYEQIVSHKYNTVFSSSAKKSTIPRSEYTHEIVLI